MGKVLGHVFPVVAPALALSSDPDRSLVRFERVVDVLDGEAPDRLASDPDLARRLALAVGSSSWIADGLAAHPSALQVLEAPPTVADRLLSAGSRYAAGELRVPEALRAGERHENAEGTVVAPGIPDGVDVRAEHERAIAAARPPAEEVA